MIQKRYEENAFVPTRLWLFFCFFLRKGGQWLGPR